MPSRLTVRERLERAIPESDVQNTVTEALTAGGWLWHHCHDSRLCLGTVGLPDLVAVHPKTGRTVWIECKTANGRTTTEQELWLEALGRDGEVQICRPADLSALVEDLVAEKSARPIRPSTPADA